MATRLLNAGHQMIVFDVSSAAVETLAGIGAKPAASPPEVGDAAEIVFTSLPSPSA